MSTVLGGLGTVSSAIRYRPAFLALASSLLTASPLVVMRIPLSPREIALSIAAIWDWVSPSCLPAATVRLTPALSAAFWASFSIETK